MDSLGSTAKVALGTYVGNAAIKATEAVGNLAKSAIEVGSNFEAAMSQVAATMGITTDQIAAGDKSFEMLSAKAKEMGQTTKFTATQAAEGLNILAMAGLSAEEAVAGIDTVLNIAAAGAMSLDQAATYVTGSVKAFSDSMENADYYADLMAKGATLANTNVSALGEAMVAVGATAASYGQEADGLTLSLLRLAEQNVTGSEAATAMNRAMMDLYTPTEKAAAELERLGIAVYDELGNAREFNTVVDELNVALSDMSQEEANASKNIIFTTFGLQAFNKMTVASTETVEKFKEGLADASGSAMQQMATQTDNLQGKLAIFQSACEAVGVSVYEVFNDNMKKSVGSATDAMDRLNRSITKGDLGKSLEHLSDSLADFLDTAIELGEDALPVIIDAAAWMIDNFPEILAMLGTFKVGMAALDFAPKIMEMAASWGAYAAANEGATVSQWLLNGAMDANPVGILIVALATLTAGVVAYAATVETVADKTKKEVEEMTAQTSKVVDNMDNAIKSARESLGEQEATATVVRNLVAELKNLNAQESLDEKQKARVRSIVATLNKEIDGLNLTIDEQTGKLDDNTAGWEDNIEAQLQQAKVNKLLEELTELNDQLIEGEIELQRLENERIGIEERRATIQEEINEAQLKYSEGMTGMTQEEIEHLRELNEELAILEGKEKANGEAKDEVREKAAGLNEELDALNVIMEQEKENTEAVADANGEAAESIAAHEAAVQEANEEYQKWRDTLVDTVAKSINIFDDFDKKTAMSSEQILKNMSEQIKGVEDWSNNLETLAEAGIDQGLLRHLAELGPQGAGYVQTFVNMSDEELKKAGELFEESIRLPESTVSQIEESYSKAGQATGESYAEGMMAKVNDGTISGSAAEQIKAGIKAMEDGLEGKGADSKPGKIGQQIPQDTAEGVEKTKDELINEVESVTTEVYGNIEEAFAPAKFVTIGEGIIEGILQGINNKKQDLDNAISDLEDTANRAKDAAGEAEKSAEKPSSGKGSSMSLFSTAMAYNSSNIYNSGAFTENILATFGQQQAELTMAASQAAPIEVKTSVYLEGEAGGVFRLVRQETDRTVRTTGNNPLLKGEYKG